VLHTITQGRTYLNLLGVGTDHGGSPEGETLDVQSGLWRGISGALDEHPVGMGERKLDAESVKVVAVSKVRAIEGEKTQKSPYPYEMPPNPTWQAADSQSTGRIPH
jgi:hypothetical protein